MDEFEDKSARFRVFWVRCFTCGRWWARETARIGTCPVCAESKLADAAAKVEALTRSTSALRGAISRLKRRVRT
jgi:hypothetical protein